MFNFWYIDLSPIHEAQMQNWIYWIRPKFLCILSFKVEDKKCLIMLIKVIE